jgi:hypothetical protein
MTIQTWIILAVAALTLYYFGRKFTRSLADHGSRSDCGCGDGGGCCGRKRPGPSKG